MICLRSSETVETNTDKNIRHHRNLKTIADKKRRFSINGKTVSYGKIKNFLIIKAHLNRYFFILIKFSNIEKFYLSM